MALFNKHDLFTISNALEAYFRLVDTDQVSIHGDKIETLQHILDVRRKNASFLGLSLTSDISQFQMTAESLERTALSVLAPAGYKIPRGTPSSLKVGNRYMLVLDGHKLHQHAVVFHRFNDDGSALVTAHGADDAHLDNFHPVPCEALLDLADGQPEGLIYHVGGKLLRTGKRYRFKNDVHRLHDSIVQIYSVSPAHFVAVVFQVVDGEVLPEKHMVSIANIEV